MPRKISLVSTYFFRSCIDRYGILGNDHSLLRYFKARRETRHSLWIHDAPGKAAFIVKMACGRHHPFLPKRIFIFFSYFFPFFLTQFSRFHLFFSHPLSSSPRVSSFHSISRTRFYFYSSRIFLALLLFFYFLEKKKEEEEEEEKRFLYLSRIAFLKNLFQRLLLQA